jgi:hypothetical protein
MVKTKLTRTIPPEQGPSSKGLNINYNTVKTVKLEKKSNGNRQITSKRS